MTMLLWLLLWLTPFGATAKCYIDPNNTFPRQGKTLRLLKRSWMTHQLVTEVAAILLEEALNYDVELVEASTAPIEDLQRVAAGEYDANFELWPQGKSREIHRYVDLGAAHMAGGHEVFAHSGIFTMKYTVEKWPQAAFYQHLRTPTDFYGPSSLMGEALADPKDLCPTAEWNCSNFTWTPPACRSGTAACSGQVLHGPVSYTQGQIEQQIANNDLGLQVVYLTPQSLATHVWNAYAERRDLLFQADQPSEGFFGLSDEHFVPVAFPPEGSGCNKSENAYPTGGLSCELGATALLKVVSPSLWESPDARRFATVFSLTRDTRRRREEGLMSAEGALRVGTSRVEEEKGYTMGQLDRRLAASRAASLGTTETSVSRCGEMRIVDLTSKLVGCSKQEYVAVKWALLKGKMNFMSFFRAEEDFCTPLGQALAPPDASSALRQFYHSKMEVLVYMFTSGFAKTLISAWTYTCVAGAVGAFLAEVRTFAAKNSRVDPWVQAQAPYLDFLSSPLMLTAPGMETVSTIVQGIDFLPVFLITYMIGHARDLVLIVNSSYRRVNDPRCGHEQRKAMFRWYRYFNAIHYLAYLNLVPSIGSSAETALQDLQTVGLLTHTEAERLRYSSAKVRDTLTSWLGRLWHEELEAHAARGRYALQSSTADRSHDDADHHETWPLHFGQTHWFTLDKGPFYAKGECVNVDALLISTERFAYHVFRNSFEKQCELRPAPTSPLGGGIALMSPK
ncbi:unnamed protein product [Durusdinium trenchii]|uniref:Solute-binding protein family 3/N-terminal domain-containing protein n=1 Tax=Durusdinium trenchii TaxID=1381693 RepID=A0ABP0RLH7_9DINO